MNVWTSWPSWLPTRNAKSTSRQAALASGNLGLLAPLASPLDRGKPGSESRVSNAVKLKVVARNNRNGVGIDGARNQVGRPFYSSNRTCSISGANMFGTCGEYILEYPLGCIPYIHPSLLPAIQHQRFLAFRVVNPLSLLHVPHYSCLRRF